MMDRLTALEVLVAIVDSVTAEHDLGPDPWTFGDYLTVALA